MPGEGDTRARIDALTRTEPLSFESTGLNLPDVPTLGMFLPKGRKLEGIKRIRAWMADSSNSLPDAIKRLTPDDIKNALTKFSVDVSVGSPVTSPVLNARQAMAMMGHLPGDSGATFTLPQFMQDLDEKIVNEVIPNGTRYSVKGGGDGHKLLARRRLGIEDVIPQERVTLSSGGVEGARMLVQRLLDKSIEETKTATGREITLVSHTITDPTDQNQWADFKRAFSDSNEDSNVRFKLEITDSAHIPDAQRIELANMLRRGNTIVVDIMTKPIDHNRSLVVDPRFQNITIGIEASGFDGTGITTVIADPKVRNIIETYHLGWWGTPSSSQLDIRVFIDNMGENGIDLFADLTDETIMRFAQKNPTHAKIATFMRLTAQYIRARRSNNPDDQVEANFIHQDLIDRHEELAAQFENRFKMAYGKLLPFSAGVDAVLVDGAARGALNAPSRLADIEVYITPKPNWPTEMTLDDKTEVIAIDGCFDSDGRLDADKFVAEVNKRLPDLRGRKVALDMKLIGNPQGMIDKPKTIDRVLDLVAENENMVVIEDIMYLTYPGKGIDLSKVQTYLARAAQRGIADRVYASFSASKDMWDAGFRAGIVMTGDKELNKKLREDRRERTPNWLSTILLNQRFADIDGYWTDVAMVNADKENRLAIVHNMFDEAKIPHLLPEVGYYIPNTGFPTLDVDNPGAVALAHAEEKLTAYNDMEAFINGITERTTTKEKGARISVGGGKVSLREGVDLNDPEIRKILQGLNRTNAPGVVDQLFDYTPFRREIARLILCHLHDQLGGSMEEVKKTELYRKYRDPQDQLVTDLDEALMELIWDQYAGERKAQLN